MKQGAMIMRFGLGPIGKKLIESVIEADLAANTTVVKGEENGTS